jgi:hypothetical protein
MPTHFYCYLWPFCHRRLAAEQDTFLQAISPCAQWQNDDFGVSLAQEPTDLFPLNLFDLFVML